jgi:hypothetical protein
VWWRRKYKKGLLKVGRFFVSVGWVVRLLIRLVGLLRGLWWLAATPKNGMYQHGEHNDKGNRNEWIHNTRFFIVN